ncbi:hypothetical protein K431DRAFT_316885 [Polychaeton citri CBS 116435]|uniref:Uncharacterized protein n=1 Tax=Polychaeton citri CBS 116435 TaxID=1314669 RepID=A0A9P4UKH9_9PEZI|nr:hypothetical protein K431DRAFT_316885 [Polychaeton citri CBS 116435]
MQSYIFTPIPPLDAPLSAPQSEEDRLRTIIESLKERRQQVHANIVAHAAQTIHAHKLSSHFQKPRETSSEDKSQSRSHLDLLLADADLSTPETTSNSNGDAPPLGLEQIHKAIETMDSYDAHFNKVLNSYTSALVKLTNGDAPHPIRKGQGSPHERPSAAPSSIQRRESGFAHIRDVAPHQTSSSIAPPTAPRALRTSSFADANHWSPPLDPHRTSVAARRDGSLETPGRLQQLQEQPRHTRPDEVSRRQTSTKDGPSGGEEPNDSIDHRLGHYVDASRDPRRRGRLQI